MEGCETRVEKIMIDDKYAIINLSSSKGVRKKFYIPSTNMWFKQDNGMEEQISNLLEYSSIGDYVRYKSLLVNGKPFCSSRGFLSPNTEEVTFARIVEHMTGSKIGDFVFRQSDIKDRFTSIIDLVEKYTMVNTSLYVRTLLYLDMLIGNPDRHFNNMAMIHNIKSDIYYPAPVFDNGAACSIENGEMCGNFGGKHEYVLSSIGKINSPIRFDYDEIDGCSKYLEDRLLRYEDVFRYNGKTDIKLFGDRLNILPTQEVNKDDVDYVTLVESKFRDSTQTTSFVSKPTKKKSTAPGTYLYKGKEYRLYQVSNETGIPLGTLKDEIKTYGFKEVFDAAFLGRTVWAMKRKYILADGSSLTKEEVCSKFGVDLEWLLKLEDENGIEYIEQHVSDGDLLNYDSSRPIYLPIPGYKFTKNELAYLLNIKVEQVDSYKSNIQKLLQMYHFKERLAFKDKAHNATWMSEDTWKYTCPECGKKLLLSAEEIKKHSHSEKFCNDNAI